MVLTSQTSACAIRIQTGFGFHSCVMPLQVRKFDFEVRGAGVEQGAGRAARVRRARREAAGRVRRRRARHQRALQVS